MADGAGDRSRSHAQPADRRQTRVRAGKRRRHLRTADERGPALRPRVQGGPDYYGLEVAAAVLSSGRTSRLYKKLVEETNVASEIACGQNAGRYPGWLAVQMELLKGQPRDKAEQLVLDEFKKLADEPIS